MTIGFIGLGNMGRGMAEILAAQTLTLRVFDLDRGAMAALVEKGAQSVAAIEDLGDCDVIITMLPAGPQVKETTQALSQALNQTLSQGTPKLFIDCSTIAVDEARERHATLADQGHTFVDAPVSGGVAAAAAGRLTFMVGAKGALFDRVAGILGPMAANIFSAGGPGNGQAAKIANNMLLGISMLGTCEAFNLAERLGLDAQTFYEISSKASGQCWSMTSYCPAPGPVKGAPSNADYAPGFSIAMMLKDLNLSQDAATGAQALTPMGQAAQKHYQWLVDSGYGPRDFSLPFDLLKKDDSYGP